MRFDIMTLFPALVRIHYYEGLPQQEITLPIRVLAALGVKTVVLTNACGGVNLAFKPGDLMLISDPINFSGASWSFTIIAAYLLTSAMALCVWWSSVTFGEGTKITALCAAQSSETELAPERDITRSAAA